MNQLTAGEVKTAIPLQEFCKALGIHVETGRLDVHENRACPRFTTARPSRKKCKGM